MKRRLMPVVAGAILLYGCATAPESSVRAVGPEASPEGVVPPGSGPEALIELEPYVAGLLTARVAVGDSTLPFLFDTGGGGTLLTPAVAESYGCRPFGRVSGFRHDGERLDGARCGARALRIGGWRSPERETAVFDLMGLLPEGLPVLGGLLSLRTFDGLPITLELAEGRLVVESRASLERRVASMAEVPLREGRQSGGAMLDVFLPFRAAGGPVWFELDSGNTGPVLVAPHAAAQLGLDLSREEPRVVTLRLEGYGPVEVEAMEKEMIYDGLLSAAFLRTVRVSLDLAGGRAWVEPAGIGR